MPLDEIEDALARTPVDLAVNVHSFSECTLASVSWWLDLLAKHRVRYLMVVPNAGTYGGTRLLTAEKDGTRLDFLRAIESRGYRLALRRPKYADPGVQKHGVSPTYHYLFELPAPSS